MVFISQLREGMDVLDDHAQEYGSEDGRSSPTPTLDLLRHDDDGTNLSELPHTLSALYKFNGTLGTEQGRRDYNRLGGEDGHGPPRKVTKADAPPSVRGSRFTRGYAIPQDLFGRASLKEFLASSNNDKPGGLKEWKAARKDYEESEQAKQDLAEAKAQAEREAEAERERKKEEREAKHEAERARLAENQEGRDFHNEIKYGAEVEKRQRLGGFTAAPVTSA